MSKIKIDEIISIEVNLPTEASLQALKGVFRKLAQLERFFGTEFDLPANTIASTPIKQQYTKIGRPSIWTETKIEELMKQYNEGNKFLEIANYFGISKEAIKSKITELRKKGKNLPLRKGAGQGWNEEQIKQLVSLYAEGKNISRIAEVLGTTKQRIASKIYNLQKEGKI